MASTRYGLVVDALVALIGATDTTVFDGPPLTSDIPTDYVIVGATDDPDEDSGDIRADWSGLGAQKRKEESDVTCCVVAWTGDDNLKATRDRALAVLDNVAAAMKADHSLGVLLPGWAHITSAVPRQRRNTNGTYFRLVFTVSYQTKN